MLRRGSRARRTPSSAKSAGAQKAPSPLLQPRWWRQRRSWPSRRPAIRRSMARDGPSAHRVAPRPLPCDQGHRRGEQHLKARLHEGLWLHQLDEKRRKPKSTHAVGERSAKIAPKATAAMIAARCAGTKTLPRSAGRAQARPVPRRQRSSTPGSSARSKEQAPSRTSADRK